MSNNILGTFDGADLEGISALIDRLEQSGFDYLKLESDEISIVIGKNGAGEVTAVPVAVPVAAPVQELPAPETTPAAVAASVDEQAGVVIVRSESYGIFYAQSEPGVPPYVSLGKPVKKGDTICLVEIMKTFTAVTAPVDGEIVAIHVKNEEMLEPDQPLVSIKTL